MVIAIKRREVYIVGKKKLEKKITSISIHTFSCLEIG